MAEYDCTNDVLEHRKRVAFWIDWLTNILSERARVHDESKLHEPEKPIYDQYIPKLREVIFASEEYNENLKKMGEALQHHYRKNEHHPEHYPRGVDGMTLWDLIEMVADWMAAASLRNQNVNFEWLKERFHLSDQLLNIIKNTMYIADIDSIAMNIPLEFQPIENFTRQEIKSKE